VQQAPELVKSPVQVAPNWKRLQHRKKRPPRNLPAAAAEAAVNSAVRTIRKTVQPDVGRICIRLFFYIFIA